MHICGITAEYNPFHNGHKYQIEKARELTNCDLLIAVMSGNFTQRGEPALVDKFTRTKAAIENGVDLVIELPYLYATQSASHFAHGAIEIMKLAQVDYVCFGSECGNLENLQEIADTPINPDHLHQSMDTGMSFPEAYSLLTSSMRPNDILGVSYLKELKDSDIKPIIVQRTSNYLDESIHDHASALAIRNAIKNKQDFHNTTPMEDILKNHEVVYMDQFYPYLRNFLLMSNREQLENFFLFNEGIEKHLVNCANDSHTFDEFINKATTIRYTSARIKRTCLQAMMQLTKNDVNSLPKMDTLRILGFNDRGREYLKEMKNTDVRIATRFAKVPRPWRELEYKSALLYSSVLSEEARNSLLEKEISGALYIK